MIDTAQQVSELLAEKDKLDRLPEGQGQFTQRQRWLLQAVELLLTIELQRHEF